MDTESLNFTELRDAEIVARMRKCNYEKFKTLVRMHLSFELDLNTDEFDLPCHEIVYEDKGKLKKWNRLSKKHKHGGVVAAALATGSAGCASVGIGHRHGSSSNSGANSTINNGYSPSEGINQQIDPGFLFHLQELKEFLMLEKNLQQEGIFRKTGSVSRQNELRAQIQNDNPLDLEYAGYSAHDCASVFKSYLADLSEPLLTDAHYPAHLQIAPLCVNINANIDDNVDKSTPVSNNAERVKKELHVLNSIQLLLLLLPDENRQLLQNIIDMLHAVALKHTVNKMGPDNLATLFAPHLICPRNLPPEALHYLAKKLSSIIAYMIVKGQEIFAVPAKLATDIRAYFLERKRKKTMSPEMTLDDSISDISTVNTVYTFVDREKTAAAHTTNTTDTELAQLYAHIQSLPESSKKRRLIKQFNKQNGQGTPLQLQAMNRIKNSEISRPAKSLSDSIKKHIFHKGIMSRTPKRQPVPEAIIVTPNNTYKKQHKQRVLFQSPNPPHALPTTSTMSANALITNAANSHTPYNIKTHPLQKSISSSSLLTSQECHTMNAKHGLSKLILNEAQESPLTSVSATASTYNSNSSNSNTNLPHSSHSNSSSDGFICRTKSLSAPVSRQISSDFQSHDNTSIKSNYASSSSLCSVVSDGMHNHLDPNCCVTPLKLISEAAKHLLAGNVDKKSVAWDDSHLLDIEHTLHPSTPFRQTPSNDLKSRYKSEPNLILSHNICDTQNSSTPHHVQRGYEMITPISKHLTGRSLTRKLMKGVSMGNLKFPFSTPESTKRLVRTVSSTLKRRSTEDSEIYQQAEGSYAAAIKSGNAPLLDHMDENDSDDDTFADESHDDSADSKTKSDTDEDEDDVDLDVDGHDDEENNLRDDVNLTLAGYVGGRRSSSSELANSFTGGASAYQQLLLQQSGIYHRNFDLVTSTPSLLLGRRSMSPITKSTQRMPKAMQESIMTPRSRKPVMVLTTTTSSTDQNQTINPPDFSDYPEPAKNNDDNNDEIENEHDNGATDEEDSLKDTLQQHKRFNANNVIPPQPEIINEDATSLGGYSEIFKRQQLLQANERFTHQNSVAITLNTDSQTSSNSQESKEINVLNNISNTDALSENFKEYLLTRSVLTTPPEDTSFTSHSDDFDSSHEIEELDENQLSSSLLFCLDGNRPEAKINADSDTTTSTTTTTDTFDGTDGTTYTDDNLNTQILSSAAATSNATSSCSGINTQKTRPQVKLITTNRLANNPFVILNNVRKRAATCDLEKISSTLFNSQAQNSPYASYVTGLKTEQENKTRSIRDPANCDILITSNSSSSNKENCDNYMTTKKLLISEYPDETLF